MLLEMSLVLNAWLSVLMELSARDVNCRILEKGYEKICGAECFHVGAINSIWPYMMSSEAHM